MVKLIRHIELCRLLTPKTINSNFNRQEINVRCGCRSAMLDLMHSSEAERAVDTDIRICRLENSLGSYTAYTYFTCQ